MKVVVSGSAGTGKTTLATALAAKFRCPLIAEAFDELFDANCEFLQPAPRLQQLISKVLDAKHVREARLPRFIADRGPADLFNMWMGRGFSCDEKATADVYARCRVYIAKYDFVIVLPWSAIPLRQINDGGFRRRTMNPWVQLHNHATVIGLLQQWVPREKLLPMPFNVVDPDDRVAYIADHLRERDK